MDLADLAGKLLKETPGLQKDASFATWPCVYGGPQCLLVCTKKGRVKGSCTKAAQIKTRWGRRRSRLLFRAGCPNSERDAVLGFTRGWACKFADGKIHDL